MGNKNVRRALVPVLAALLVVASAPAALAAVSKNGYQVCPEIYQDAYARAYATGEVWMQAPGQAALYEVGDSGNSWRVYNKTVGKSSGAWQATSFGSLNDPGTYSYCSG